jgi:hypothetical protein
MKSAIRARVFSNPRAGVKYGCDTTCGSTKTRRLRARGSKLGRELFPTYRGQRHRERRDLTADQRYLIPYSHKSQSWRHGDERLV